MAIPRVGVASPLGGQPQGSMSLADLQRIQQGITDTQGSVPAPQEVLDKTIPAIMERIPVADVPTYVICGAAMLRQNPTIESPEDLVAASGLS